MTQPSTQMSQSSKEHLNGHTRTNFNTAGMIRDRHTDTMTEESYQETVIPLWNTIPNTDSLKSKMFFSDAALLDIIWKES